MYLEQYGLKKSPFNITADPYFFFESLSHKQALAALTYGIHERKGIILVTGEVGTGKTTLCRTLLDKLPKSIKTSVILDHPCFSESQLLNAIVGDFGLKPAKNRLDTVKKLDTFLVETAMNGGNAVLVIDEAQGLTNRQLEQIRLLSNLEISEGKLLQIILFGQPELTAKLKQFKLRQIHQRIFVKHNISPLSEEEVSKYVEHRLQKAGINDIDIFPESYNVIYEFSKGIPRLINMLCDRALLWGFAKDRKDLDKEVFTACVKELQ